MSYSENQLKDLANSNPKELARIITSPNTDIRSLSFGAEFLGGQEIEEDIVLPALRQLLKHINAIVREGAMVGLSNFYVDKKPPQDILDKLRLMSVNDPSPTLKDFSKSLLKDFELIV